MTNAILIDSINKELKGINLKSPSEIERYLQSNFIDYVPIDDEHYLFYSDDKKFKNSFQFNELKFRGYGLIIRFDIINIRLSNITIDINELTINFSTKTNFFTKFFN